MEIKDYISETVKASIKERGSSYRKLAKDINKSYSQIARLTGCENYTIDLLISVLKGLDLEITIKKKS